jgi:hypothetical protein
MVGTILSSKWATTFCENETNNRKIYNVPNEVDYVKDGINDYIVHGKATVNPELNGSKVAIWHPKTKGRRRKKALMLGQ